MARRKDVSRTIVFLVLLLAARLPLCIAVGALPVATPFPSHNGNSAAASVRGAVYALATVRDIAGPAVADSVSQFCSSWTNLLMEGQQPQPPQITFMMRDGSTSLVARSTDWFFHGIIHDSGVWTDYTWASTARVFQHLMFLLMRDNRALNIRPRVQFRRGVISRLFNISVETPSSQPSLENEKSEDNAGQDGTTDSQPTYEQVEHQTTELAVRQEDEVQDLQLSTRDDSFEARNYIARLNLFRLVQYYGIRPYLILTNPNALPFFLVDTMIHNERLLREQTCQRVFFVVPYSTIRQLRLSWHHKAIEDTNNTGKRTTSFLPYYFHTCTLSLIVLKSINLHRALMDFLVFLQLHNISSRRKFQVQRPSKKLDLKSKITMPTVST